VPEPLGGAHRGRDETIASLGAALEKSLTELDGLSGDDLRRTRREKFLAMGEKGLG